MFDFYPAWSQRPSRLVLGDPSFGLRDWGCLHQKVSQSCFLPDFFYFQEFQALILLSPDLTENALTIQYVFFVSPLLTEAQFGLELQCDQVSTVCVPRLCDNEEWPYEPVLKMKKISTGCDPGTILFSWNNWIDWVDPGLSSLAFLLLSACTWSEHFVTLRAT